MSNKTRKNKVAVKTAAATKTYLATIAISGNVARVSRAHEILAVSPKKGETEVKTAAKRVNARTFARKLNTTRLVIS